MMDISEIYTDFRQIFNKICKHLDVDPECDRFIEVIEMFSGEEGKALLYAVIQHLLDLQQVFMFHRPIQGGYWEGGYMYKQECTYALLFESRELARNYSFEAAIARAHADIISHLN